MKKLFLTFALVFATGTMMNANTVEVLDRDRDCIGFAFALEVIIGHEMTYDQFSAVVDACEAL